MFVLCIQNIGDSKKVTATFWWIQLSPFIFIAEKKINQDLLYVSLFEH